MIRELRPWIWGPRPWMAESVGVIGNVNTVTDIQEQWGTECRPTLLSLPWGRGAADTTLCSRAPPRGLAPKDACPVRGDGGGGGPGGARREGTRVPCPLWVARAHVHPYPCLGIRIRF